MDAYVQSNFLFVERVREVNILFMYSSFRLADHLVKFKFTDTSDNTIAKVLDHAFDRV